jgi:hypothetical protein
LPTTLWRNVNCQPTMTLDAWNASIRTLKVDTQGLSFIRLPKPHQSRFSYQ